LRVVSTKNRIRMPIQLGARQASHLPLQFHSSASLSGPCACRVLRVHMFLNSLVIPTATGEEQLL
jgi:hypothetical protein